MVFVWILVVLAALVLLYILSVGIICQRRSVARENDIDYNFHPGVDDPDTFLLYGNTPYRVAAREGNVWWNTQKLEPYTVVSHDGLKLAGNLLRADSPDSKKVALVIHGHRCVSGEMGFIARIYHNRGYHVLMPDQRAHGRSEGQYIGFGYFESLDMMRWLDCINGIFPDCTIVLHGISMGAATVMMMADNPAMPANVVCAVEDCGYTNASAAIEAEARKAVPKLFFCRAFIFMAGIINLFKAHYHFARCNSLRSVRRAKLPMLFIHGTADTVVPFRMLEPLYNAHPGPKRQLIVPDALHGVAYFSDTERYEKAVFDFIEEYMK